MYVSVANCKYIYPEDILQPHAIFVVENENNQVIEVSLKYHIINGAAFAITIRKNR